MRKSLLVACALAFLLCLLLWKWRQNPKGDQAPEGAPVPTSQEDLQPSGDPARSDSQPKQPDLKAPSREIAQQDWKRRSNEFYQAWVNSNVPIDFYGKVVDEASNAVAGATIGFAWNKDDTTNPMHRGTSRRSMQSDSAGMFSFKGERGRFLDIEISKSGYYTPRPGSWSFRYSDSSQPLFSPDPLNPVIFVLRGKGAPEPLIRLAGAMAGDRQYRLDAKGTPTEISFYTSERMATGQGHLRVEYWMDVPQDPMQRQYSWRCRITVPGGGLILTSEEFPFTAPKGGYAESVEIASESKPESWSDRINQSYYVRLSDGKYGRIKLSVVCSANPFFGVEALVNPSGSRNLEYDKYLAGNTLVNQSSP